MKDPKKEEIRRALLGKAVIAEDGRLAVIPEGDYTHIPLGIGDGAGAVRFFGVMRRMRRYKTKDGSARVMKAAAESMKHIGRALALQEQPQTVACLIRYILTRPAALTFAYENGAPVLTAWTGRGLTGWLSIRRAIRAFERRLPDSMEPEEIRKPVEKKKDKSAKENDAKGKSVKKSAAKDKSAQESASTEETTERKR